MFSLTDVPDDILERLKWLKDGLDAINKWKDEVLACKNKLALIRMHVLVENKNKTKSFSYPLNSFPFSVSLNVVWKVLFVVASVARWQQKLYIRIP